MLAQSERSSTRMVVFAFAIVVIGMIGLALRSTSTEPAPPSSSAVFVVGGTTYEFAPSSCTVTSTDFLAAGSGQIDGEDFWISVSPEAAEVALGTADESSRSDDAADLWLRNDGGIRWTAEGDTAEGSLAVRNERTPESGSQIGRFSVDCST